MLQRSIEAPLESACVVIVRASWDCQIEGYDGTRIIAETDNALAGMQMKPKRNALEINFGGSGRVRVPFNSQLTIHAGRDATVQNVRGPVLANVGGSLHVTGCVVLMPCNAGKHMDIDCESLIEGDVRFHAGGNLRFHVHTLVEGRIMVNDGAGYWEGRIGAGLTPVRLKCGGSFTLVTEQPVSGTVLGHIEGPRAESHER